MVLYIYLLLWIVSSLIYIQTKNRWSFLIPYVFFILDDAMSCPFNMSFITGSQRTAFFYDMSMIPTYTKAVDTNYSEGYFLNDDITILPKQAEIQKFDKVIKLLNITPGEKVLTFGCGTCTLEMYFKSKGFDVYGITISKEQVVNCKKNGIKAMLWNMTKFNEKLENRFDHIVMMGSTEHVHTGCVSQMETYKKKFECNRDLFKIVHKYLKPGGNVYFSGLHLNKKFIDSREMYITDRMCGSTYTLNDTGVTMKDSAEANNFKTEVWNDITKHYYLMTLMDNKHFGAPMSPYSLSAIMMYIGMFFVPPFIYFLEFYLLGYWMWGFDGKHHYDWKKQYSLKNMEERPWTLWEGVFTK